MQMQDVLGLILGGGAGTRLYPLTKERAKPAVPLAGKYRLIDIPMSNCLHAGIDKIAILIVHADAVRITVIGNAEGNAGIIGNQFG